MNQTCMVPTITYCGDNTLVPTRDDHRSPTQDPPIMTGCGFFSYFLAALQGACGGKNDCLWLFLLDLRAMTGIDKSMEKKCQRREAIRSQRKEKEVREKVKALAGIRRA